MGAGLEDMLNGLTWLDAFTDDDLRTAQGVDTDIGIVVSWVRDRAECPNREELAPYSDTVKRLVLRWKRLNLKNRLLFSRSTIDGKEVNGLVLPVPLRERVLHQLHDLRVAGHLGVTKTYKRVAVRFYWPDMSIDVARWCAKCTKCQARKGGAPPKKSPLQQWPTGAPFERIAMDILDTHRVTSRGHRYVLVISDYFTKWTEAIPLRRHTAEKVAAALMEYWVVRMGVPHQIHSDQGREFEGELVRSLAKMLGSQKIRTAPYHAQSDGQVERFNRTLLGMLSAFVNEQGDDWDQHLPFVMSAYRSSVHASTGTTPNMMVHGRESNLPVDVMFPCASAYTGPSGCGPEYVDWVRRALASAHDMARQHLGRSAIRQKRGYDVRTRSRAPFKENDLVRYYYLPLRNANKFALPWLGPYRVVRRVGEVDYKIELLSDVTKRRVVHVDDLKLYEGQVEAEVYPESEIPEVPEPEVVDDGFATDGTTLCPDVPSYEDTAVCDADSESSVNEESGSPTRYPRRDRRPPNRLGSWIYRIACRRKQDKDA
jgi:transposase InsO family protein